MGLYAYGVLFHKHHPFMRSEISIPVRHVNMSAGTCGAIGRNSAGPVVQDTILNGSHRSHLHPLAARSFGNEPDACT